MLKFLSNTVLKLYCTTDVTRCRIWCWYFCTNSWLWKPFYGNVLTFFMYEFFLTLYSLYSSHVHSSHACEYLVILKKMYIESYLNKTLDDFRFWLASKIGKRCWPYAWTKISGTTLNVLIPHCFQKGRLFLIACLTDLLEGEPYWTDSLNPIRA